jgi:hypothetical protein
VTTAGAAGEAVAQAARTIDNTANNQIQFLICFDIFSPQMKLESLNEQRVGI